MMRGSFKRGIRVVIVVVVLSMIWLQLALPPLPHDPPNGVPESLEPDPSLRGQPNTPLQALMKKIIGPREVLTPTLSKAQIWDIWERIVEHSALETIHNAALYGPVTESTIVIVVQVHNRLEYLRHLIGSLAEVRSIESSLLIFSHDFFDETINRLIMSIDFCKVMQVFYPHSLQLHPSNFPGHSQGDCPRDTNPKVARKLQCRGNPDLYGHYREPRYTQTKHHWWWKTNKVFESVLAPFNHTGLVLFLEEDHYVSEDLVHMLALLFAALPHACPHCSLLTLGNYLKNYNWANDAKKIEISPWLSSKHNMGFAFNRTTWRKIQACGDAFCTHDDYNWDWSLQQVSNVCLQSKLYTMVLRAPRVFHIGECGVHHKKKDCSSKLVLNKVYRTMQTAKRALFPLKLIIIHAPPKKLKKHKGNGGWGDHRDQELCKSFVNSTGLYHPLVTEPSPPVYSVPLSQADVRTSTLTGNSSLVKNSTRTDLHVLFPNIGTLNKLQPHSVNAVNVILPPATARISISNSGTNVMDSDSTLKMQKSHSQLTRSISNAEPFPGEESSYMSAAFNGHKSNVTGQLVHKISLRSLQFHQFDDGMQQSTVNVEAEYKINAENGNMMYRQVDEQNQLEKDVKSMNKSTVIPNSSVHDLIGVLTVKANKSVTLEPVISELRSNCNFSGILNTKPTIPRHERNFSVSSKPHNSFAAFPRSKLSLSKAYDSKLGDSSEVSHKASN